MNKNTISSVFRILNILKGAAREPKNKEPKKKKSCRRVSTRYRNRSQSIYF